MILVIFLDVLLFLFLLHFRQMAEAQQEDKDNSDRFDTKLRQCKVRRTE